MPILLPVVFLLFLVIREYWPGFQAELAGHGRQLPAYVKKEFDEYLKCGMLNHGFLRVRCESCHDEKLIAFSCKKRGFCPSCGARRMADSAVLLVTDILPHQPMRQWVLSVPFPLRFRQVKAPAALNWPNSPTPSRPVSDGTWNARVRGLATKTRSGRPIVSIERTEWIKLLTLSIERRV